MSYLHLQLSLSFCIFPKGCRGVWMELVSGSQLEPPSSLHLPAQAVVLPPSAGIKLPSGPLRLSHILPFFTFPMGEISHLEIQYHIRYGSSYFKLSKCWPVSAIYDIRIPDGLGFSPQFMFVGIWMYVWRKITFTSLENFFLELGEFWFWKLHICAYIRTVWLFARISFTWQFREQQSVVDKLFLIICKLFITNYNQCGWNDWLTSVSRLMPSKSQRAYCNYLEYGHTVILDSGRSYAIAAFLNCPSFPSLGDQLYIQRNCLVYETDLCSRRNLFFTEFSAHLGLWNIKGTCRNQDNILITASACSAEAGAALESISVTLGSRCIWMV